MVEKIVNGDFQNGTTSWTTAAGTHETNNQGSYGLPTGTSNVVTEIDGAAGVADRIHQDFSFGPGEVNKTQTLTLDLTDRLNFSEIGGLGINIVDLTTGTSIPLTGVSGAGFTQRASNILELDALTEANLQTATITFTPQSVGNYRLTFRDFQRGTDGLGVVFDNVSLDAICFACGTRIKTREGERLIEDLRAGEMVMTMDNGYQPIRWIGGNKLGKAALAANDRLLPIRIRAGALGAGMPEQDLRVSPQHRVLVRSKIAQRMFGCEEVLVPAKKLLMLDGIEIEMVCDEVEYFHMLFDAHQIVFANGALAESLYTGPEALKAVSPAAREEILTLFPEMASPGFIPKPARLIPEKGKLVKSLIARHAKNQVAICGARG